MKVKISLKFLIILIVLAMMIFIITYSLSSRPKSKLENIADDDPFLGPAHTKVTIVEFSDYACPFCARAEATIKQILQNYPQVKWVYRDFPVHEQGWKAAEAANCAGEQGKYWEYHDLLFENQKFLSVRDLKIYAIRLNLSSAEFDDCLDSGKYTSEVKKDFNDGKTLGVTAVPTFFINGKIIVGAQPYSVFQTAIEEVLTKSQE